MSAGISAPVLSVSDVKVVFGGIVALDGVSFDVPKSKIVGLIGPNGAGKTTLFNCLSRVYTPTSGQVLFNGTDLLKLASHKIAKVGIGRTFQNLALFPDLTVFDNVRIGAHSQLQSNFIADALGLPTNRRNERAIKDTAQELIDYLQLGSVANERVADLPFGSQKRVELARALAINPKLLLLDEPACGLNHEEVDDLGRLIQKIRAERSVSILLVEHHMQLVMSVCDFIVALNFGRKIAEGTPHEVRTNPDVIAAYLGPEKSQ